MRRINAITESSSPLVLIRQAGRMCRARGEPMKIHVGGVAWCAAQASLVLDLVRPVSASIPFASSALVG